MPNTKNNILIYAIGNPARGDDGFGPAVLEQLKLKNLKHADFQVNYQLNIEDAELFSRYQLVIIIDAAKTSGGLQLKELQAEDKDPFSTHALTPRQVLALSQNLYQKQFRCYILTTSGYNWDLGCEISESVEKDISLAIFLILDFIKKELKTTFNQ